MGGIFGKNCDTGDCDCDGDFIPPEPCYICPCLIGNYTVDILVKTDHIAADFSGESDPEAAELGLDCFNIDKDYLTGLITLIPITPGGLPIYCTGGWQQCDYAGPCVGFAIDYCDNSPGLPIPRLALPHWRLGIDVPNNLVYLGLYWFGAPCGFFDLSLYAGIRWKYEFDSDACEDVDTLAWTGVVEVFSYDDDGLPAWTDVSSDGDRIAWFRWGIDDPRPGIYTADVNNAPEIFLNREGCSEDPCCAEEGGPPTAIMDLVVDACRVTATDVSIAGTCGAITRRLWVVETWFSDTEPELFGTTCADEPDHRQSIYGEGTDEETINISAGRECGGQWFRVTLHVWDEVGCHSSATSGFYSCCNCEDAYGVLCADPPCGLTATLISEEGEVPCVYRLENPASDEGYEGVCANTAFTEIWGIGSLCVGDLDPDLDCTCEEMIAGDCGGTNCSLGIGPGNHTDISIDTTVTIKYRCKEGSCGCGGEIHELELPCQNCYCCEDPLLKVMVTIGGVAGGDSVPECTNCGTKINGTYEVFFTGSCFAQLTLAGHFTCECDPDPCNNDLDIQVGISCADDVISIFASFSSPATGQIDFARDISVAALPAENCATILDGALTNITGPGPCSGVQCDGCDATMSLDFVAV